MSQLRTPRCRGPARCDAVSIKLVETCALLWLWYLVRPIKVTATHLLARAHTLAAHMSVFTDEANRCRTAAEGMLLVNI
jgi:hypothetical protein